MPEKTEVLIVGGSLTGLSTALFLSNWKVPCVVVERHPSTSIQYKLRGISPRSMEIYRAAGIEADIRTQRTGDQKSGGIARVKNLADPNVVWMGQSWAETEDISPVTAETCDQDVLEPILRSHAERSGADVRFNTEMLKIEHKEEGVVGSVRPQLGIERHGPGVLQYWINVIFDTDLQSEHQRSIRPA